MKTLYYICAFSLIGCSSPPLRTPTSLNKIVIPTAQQSIDDCETFQKQLPADLKRGYITRFEGKGDALRETKVFYYGRWTKHPLVIANGGPGLSSWSTYRDLGPALDKEKIEYLFFDQKGTGCSSAYPQLDEKHFPIWMNYSSKGLAADIELLRQKLNLGNKITLFGHSFGSKIALRYAMEFPKSTHAILFYGDSFVAPEQDLVRSLTSALERQQNFLNQRIAANPKLESTLKSLARKFNSAPCAGEERMLVSACGYDLIRDLGHYYSESSADRIEELLFKLDDPQSADEALQETVLKYTRWKLDPATLLLGFMDYRHFINGQLVCDQALQRLQIPNWALNSCAIAKHRFNFLKQISKFLRPELVLSQDVFKILRAYPSLKAYAFESRGDLSSSDKGNLDSPPNWIAVELNGVDHAGYYKSREFWNAVNLALQQ